jgi:hypothetical protein
MHLSDKNLIVNLSHEYEDIKIIMSTDETHQRKIKYDG